MRTRPGPNLAAALVLLAAASAGDAAPLVYQGQLMDAGQPANGTYDLRLTPHRDATSADALAAAITFEDVQVANGQFRVEGDFGTTLESNAGPWLEVAVRDGAGNGAFSAIRVREKATLAPLIGQCWSTTGDTGSNPATNFLGSTDAQPLVLRVQNQQVARYEPSTTLFNGVPNTANVIEGSAANNVQATVHGATISGGGTPAGDSELNLALENPNRVTNHYGTVGGGYGNRAGDNDGGNAGTANFATVGGGFANIASDLGTVSGGGLNCAGGIGSWAGGVNAKVRADSIPGTDCNTASGTVPNSGDFEGDEGTFAWADQSPAGQQFVSTGPNQFLIRSTGGMVVQPVIGAETNARKPRVQFNVVTGASGVDPDLDLRANTSAVFERSTANFIRILAPSNLERGVLFGDELSAASAGVVYNGTEMQFRVGSNATRMTLGTSGALTLNSANAIKTGGGSWLVPSDARLKTRVRDLDGALDRLLRLRGVSFEFTHPDSGFHPAGEHIGFVAQEVQTVFPNWVGRSDDGYLTVGSQGFEALAVEALRELKISREVLDEQQQATIDELHESNARLAAQNAGLTAALARLAHRLDVLERAGKEMAP